MARIAETVLNKTELLERVGDISQVCDARKMKFSEGRASGVEVIEVTTGSGLAFTVVPSRGLDISRASYNGVPIAWQSSTGEVSPYFYDSGGLEWLRGFFGGLLTTCGMTYASHPCEDNGELLGLHGRVSHIPAEEVNVQKTWDGDDYTISISGKVREAKVFGDNLVLNRNITTSLGYQYLRIVDTIENIGFRESPLMMLYHVNIGWPVVSEHSKLIAPDGGHTGLDESAKREPDSWDTFLPPQESYLERVYLHDFQPAPDGTITLALVNEKRKIGVYMRYPRSEFPHFIQWKMMGRGEYVVGIEPGNITGHRAYMRKKGTLEFISPGAKRKFSLEIGVLSGQQEIKKCIDTIKKEKNV